MEQVIRASCSFNGHNQQVIVAESSKSSPNLLFTPCKTVVLNLFASMYHFFLHVCTIMFIKKLIISIYLINKVIKFSAMVVSAFPEQVALCAAHRTNCTLEIMKRQWKAISAFGFNTFYCREALLTFPCDGEYYDNT